MASYLRRLLVHSITLQLYFGLPLWLILTCQLMGILHVGAHQLKFIRNHINKELWLWCLPLFHHVLVHVKLNQKLLVLKGTFDNKWLLCQLKKRLLGYYLLTTFFFTKELLPVCRKSLLNKTLGDLPASKKLWYI